MLAKLSRKFKETGLGWRYKNRPFLEVQLFRENSVITAHQKRRLVVRKAFCLLETVFKL